MELLGSREWIRECAP